MKKLVALILLISCVLACSMIVGCSGAKSDKTTVVFYHTMGQNLRTVLQKYIAEFNKIYPEIVIDEQSIGGYDDVRDQVINELQAGKQPALAYCYPDHVATYLRSKKVIDLNTYINDETVGLTEAQIKDFIAGYYAEGTQFGDETKMYSLPFSKSTEVMYYNKTFFDANGLSVPDHWFSTDSNDTTSMEYVIKKIKQIDPNSIPTYVAEKGGEINMATAGLPANEGNTSSSVGVKDVMMAFRDDSAPDQAARNEAIGKFMQFFYDPVNYVDWVSMEGFLPAVNSAVSALVEADPSFEAWLDILATCKFYPTSKAEWAQVRQGVTTVEQDALTGADVRAGLDALQAEVTK